MGRGPSPSQKKITLGLRLSEVSIISLISPQPPWKGSITYCPSHNEAEGKVFSICQFKGLTLTLGGTGRAGLLQG